MSTDPIVFHLLLEETETGRLLPRNKCGSRDEFGDKGVPRLFASPSAAAQALNCWRQGVWHQVVDSYGESEGPMPPDPAKPWNVDVIKRRQATGDRRQASSCGGPFCASRGKRHEMVSQLVQAEAADVQGVRRAIASSRDVRHVPSLLVGGGKPMTRMSPELRSELVNWLEWVESGAPRRNYFGRYSGLCDAMPTYQINDELCDAFEASGLDRQYPFGRDNWWKRHHLDTQHECPLRLAWVRMMLADG